MQKAHETNRAQATADAAGGSAERDTFPTRAMSRTGCPQRVHLRQFDEAARVLLSFSVRALIWWDGSYLLGRGPCHVQFQRLGRLAKRREAVGGLWLGVGDTI